jgi:hypothetical protein
MLLEEFDRVLGDEEKNNWLWLVIHFEFVVDSFFN